MTRIKAISAKRFGPRVHLWPDNPDMTDILRFQLQSSHGRTLRQRLLATANLLASIRNHLRNDRSAPL